MRVVAVASFALSLCLAAAGRLAADPIIYDNGQGETLSLLEATQIAPGPYLTMDRLVPILGTNPLRADFNRQGADDFVLGPGNWNLTDIH